MTGIRKRGEEKERHTYLLVFHLKGYERMHRKGREKDGLSGFFKPKGLQIFILI